MEKLFSCHLLLLKQIILNLEHNNLFVQCYVNNMEELLVLYNIMYLFPQRKKVGSD